MMVFVVLDSTTTWRLQHKHLSIPQPWNAGVAHRQRSGHSLCEHCSRLAVGVAHRTATSLELQGRGLDPDWIIRIAAGPVTRLLTLMVIWLPRDCAGVVDYKHHVLVRWRVIHWPPIQVDPASWPSAPRFSGGCEKLTLYNLQCILYSLYSHTEEKIPF